MTKTVLFGSAAVLALSAGTAIAAKAPAVSAKAPVHRVISALPGSVTLYDQTGNAVSNAISSQNFESSFDAYDDQAADDFKVPSGHKWKVKEVDVLGVNFGGAPANSLHVIVYKNSGGIPGGVKADCDGLSNAGYNGFGGYAIKIPKTCKIALKGGTYWVSVIANQNFGTDSQWFWDANQSSNGAHGQWQNPGGGFGLSNCISWCDDSNVFGYSTDLAFALKGKDVVL